MIDLLNKVGLKDVLEAVKSKCALRSKYGDTTIDVGRQAGTTVGNRSTAEGRGTTASGDCSHAEGWATTASGDYSHAEGLSTTASGDCSHAEGNHTKASGIYSHAGGLYTKALRECEVAYGRYNQSNSDTLFSIGNGSSDTARSNAFEITMTGGKLHDKNIAVIHTATIIGTTDALGDIGLWGVSENKIPVCIKGPDATRCVVITGYSGTAYMVNITDITTQNAVANTEVSLTIYYTEI